MKSLFFILTILAVIVNPGFISAQQEISVSIRNDKEQGTIRALNGGQLSPVCNYKLLDLTEEFKALNIPIVRLHDAPWFNENVVDVHMIFTNFDLDPKKEANYDFRQTDAYLSAILNTGTKVVFRLGESIEHTKEHYYVNPPKDYAKWAQICCGIIRHYNEGWANGFHHNIKYWEIWNEPDGSAATWNGTPEQFYEFFATAAKIIKKEFPSVMIGGPGMAGPLKSENGKFVTTDWTKNFLVYCQKNSVPMDFFSWHNYNNDPFMLAKMPASVRELLNQYGFSKTESHLNEWNYIPGNEWGRLFGGGIYQGERRRLAYSEQSGSRGAAFVADVLMLLQDEPIDVANFYITTAGMFGIFSEYGEPLKNYYAFKAFAELLKTPVRIESVYPKEEGIVVCAGKNKEQSITNILISNFSDGMQFKLISLNVSGINAGIQKKVEVYQLDLSHNLTKIREFETTGSDIKFTEVLPSASVMLIRIF